MLDVVLVWPGAVVDAPGVVWVCPGAVAEAPGVVDVVAGVVTWPGGVKVCPGRMVAGAVGDPIRAGRCRRGVGRATAGARDGVAAGAVDG